METRQMTQFFHVVFTLYLYHLFLNLKILKIHFHVVLYFVHPGRYNTSTFDQMLNLEGQGSQGLPIQTAHHAFIGSNHPEDTKNIMSCAPAGAKY